MHKSRIVTLVAFAGAAVLAGAAGVSVVACSGRGASIDGAGADSGGGDGAMLDGGAPNGDAADDASALFVYGQCTNAKPLTAGAHTGANSSVTLRWPTPWTALTPQPSTNTYTLNAPYSYVPTGKTAAVPSSAAVTLWDDEVRTSDADLKKRIDDAVAAVPPANLRRFLLDGHPAVLYWQLLAPPQSGCQGCPVDPGPDYVAITLFASNGVRLVQFTGQARVNATDDLFCDIQAIALGLAFKP